MIKDKLKHSSLDYNDGKEKNHVKLYEIRKKNLLNNKNIQMIVGIILMSVAYKGVYDSAGMVTGGFSGIGVIVRVLSSRVISGGIPLWITNIILNVPLFIAAYITVGKVFVKKTIAGAVLLTVFLAIIPSINIEETDFLLIAVFGGSICGLGVGLVLLSGAATGGTDMLAVIIQKYMRHYSVVQIMQVLDGIIVIAGVVVFGLNVSLYAVIAIYVTSLVSDRVLEGPLHGCAVLIISDKYLEISKCITNKMKRGVTQFEGEGMYTNNKKNVLLCIVSKKEIPQLKQICNRIDNKSFLSICDVREVYGEGFVQNSQ